MADTEPVPPALVAGLLAAYVLVSSVLGLTGRFILPNAGGVGSAWGFFVWVWSASLLADAVFVLGTVGAGVLAYRLASERGAAWSAGAALAANWLVYVASFALLPQGDFGDGDWFNGLATETWSLTAFVGAWGVVGLVFATAAPVAAWLLIEGTDR